jgi:O-antigen ligase
MDRVALRLMGFSELKAMTGLCVMAVFVVSIFLSTALTTVFSIMVGIAWLVSGQYRHLEFVYKSMPVAVWATLLFLCLLVGLAYGDAPNALAYSTVNKYRELLYIPLLACFFIDDRYRAWAWKAFVIGSVITLLSSYLVKLGLLDINKYKSTVTIKSRITHSIFLAFFAFYCLHQIYNNDRYKFVYWGLLLLTIHNLYFVTAGRTGQFVCLLLVLLFALQRLSKKSLVVTLVILMLFIVGFLNFSERAKRVVKGFQTAGLYLNNPAYQGKVTDGDLRFAYWKNTLKIIEDKPLIGYGTGSFNQEYRRVTNNDKEILENPHNEYLLFTVQCGIIGLALHVFFLFAFYRSAKRQPQQERMLGYGLLLTLIFTSQFNSPFLDNAEGHWFAVMISLLCVPFGESECSKFKFKEIIN